MKKVKITPPEGFEIDKERSTFEEICFKPIEGRDLTWAEIQMKNIRANKKQFYMGSSGQINYDFLKDVQMPIVTMHHVPTERDAIRIRALCQALVIAEYYNEGWQPDWEDGKQEKYYMSFNTDVGGVMFFPAFYSSIFHPYFKDEATARRAYNANKDIFDTLLKP